LNHKAIYHAQISHIERNMNTYHLKDTVEMIGFVNLGNPASSVE